MTSPTLPSGQWLADLDAALAKRGERGFPRLTSRDISDLLWQREQGASPEDVAAILCGERDVPRPWAREVR